MESLRNRDNWLVVKVQLIVTIIVVEFLLARQAFARWRAAQWSFWFAVVLDRWAAAELVAGGFPAKDPHFFVIREDIVAREMEAVQLPFVE